MKPDKAGKLAVDSYALGTAHALARRVALDAQELAVALARSCARRRARTSHS